MIKSNKIIFLSILFSLLVFGSGCSLQQTENIKNTGYIKLSINDSDINDVYENARTIRPEIDTSLITNIKLYGTITGGLRMTLGSWDTYTSMITDSSIAVVPGEWELSIELYYNYNHCSDTKNVTITANTYTSVNFTLSSYNNYNGNVNLKIKYYDYSSVVNRVTAKISKYPSMEEVDSRDLYVYTEDGMKYVEYSYYLQTGVYYILISFYSADGELNRYSNIVKIQNGFTSKEEYYMNLNTIPLGYVNVYSSTVSVTMAYSESQVFNGRSISIPRLLVSDHEVTQGEWKSLFGVEQKDMNAVNNGWGDDYPVYYVNWYGAIAYCNKKSALEGKTLVYEISGISYDDWKTFAYSSIPTSDNSTWNSVYYNEYANGWRLPTEAEWEYIAREGNFAGEPKLYSGNSNANYVAWYSANSLGKAHAVRTQKISGINSSNEYGIYDMSGNVAEWCWDWKSVINSSTSQNGPTTGEYRVVRGGSWNDGTSECKVSYRETEIHPEDRNNYTGFRIVHKVN